MGKRDLAPLSGVLFIVLVLVAFFGLGGSTPDGDASAAKVVSFYSDNDTKEMIAAVVLALSTVPLLYFAALLRNRLGEALPERSALPGFALAAGATTAAGFVLSAGIHFTLADYADNIRPVALQAINALDSDLFLAFTTGLAAFVLAVSLGSRRTGVLPTWLAWVGIVLFIVYFTPVGFIAFGLTGIWVIVASILLYLRGEPAAPQHG